MSVAHHADAHSAQAHREAFSIHKSWAECTAWEELPRIRESALSALVLRRASGFAAQLPPLPEDWSQPGAGRNADADLPAQVLAERLCAHLAPGRFRAFLEADVQACILAFQALISGVFQLALGPIARVQCPKFHADHVTLRLLCSYVGPGTEWLEEEHVRREALGSAFADIREANRNIQCCPEGLQRAETGDVLLLKGERWPGHQGRGVVHRSPALAPGQQRLVLTLTAGASAPR